jgi:hypothetical protein
MAATSHDEADRQSGTANSNHRKVVIDAGVDEIEIDLTAARHIRVYGITRNGKSVERLLNITQRGGISLV